MSIIKACFYYRMRAAYSKLLNLFLGSGLVDFASYFLSLQYEIISQRAISSDRRNFLTRKRFTFLDENIS